jgi:drug/metabolite transporter (DMT)-like permease
MTQTSYETQPDRVFLSAAAIIFAVFLMAMQDAIVKLASVDLSLWQIFVLRSAIALPALAVVTTLRRDTGTMWRDAFGFWLFLRATLLTAMYVSLYASIPVLPLATLAAGFYTGPLFIAVLSAWTIGEPVRRMQWLALLIGFVGVLLILRPGSGVFTWLVLLPVLSGFFYALAAVLTRSRCRKRSPVTLAISLNVVLLMAGAVASLALVPWRPAMTEAAPFLLGNWAAMDAAAWVLVFVLAVLIVGIGVGLAAAYQSAPPATVATFDYSYLVFSAIFGILLFGEVPGLQTLAGMGLIAGAGLLVVR